MKKPLLAAASALLIATSVPASATYYNWPSDKKECEFKHDFLGEKLTSFYGKYGSWKNGGNKEQNIKFHASKYLYLKKILAWKHSCYWEILCRENRNADFCDVVISPDQ